MTSVTLEDRPIEQVREEVIDKLIYNYSRGVISAEAFERRLDDAMASDDHQKIVDLAADLPMQADSSFKQQKDESFSINYTKSPSSESLKLLTILSKSYCTLSSSLCTKNLLFIFHFSILLNIIFSIK